MTDKELDEEIEGRKEYEKESKDEEPECIETTILREHEEGLIKAGAPKILKDLEKTAKKVKPEKVIDPLSLSGIPGLGPVGIKALEAEGTNTTLAVICKHPTWLAEVTGMTRPKASEAFTYMKNNLEKSGHIQVQMQTASELLLVRKKIPRVKTGCNTFDDLLNGGIESRTLTEFHGENGSGKSQLCHLLALQTQRPTKDGGLWAETETERPVVLFIDTEGTCRPERFISILEGKKLIVGVPSVIKTKIDGGKSLTKDEIETVNKIRIQQEVESRIFTDNIIVRRSTNAYDLILQIKNAVPQIKELNIKLIILDSGTALFRSDYLGRGNIKAKFDLMNEMVHDLKMIAENYNIPIVFINQIYHKPDIMYGADPDIPYGGNIVGHAIPYRIKLWKSGKKHGAKIIKSPCQANEDIRFIITEGGFEDAP